MRSADDIIVELVQDGARVLDLGCGDGDLLKRLGDQKNVTGYGVEVDADRITKCLERGVNVIEHDIDAGLERFPASSFDVVILNQTLQALRDPRGLVLEMLRIGQECVVTFPNFAYWRCRMQLAKGGRMPVSDHLPHQWHDTPNIHLCTIRDFDLLCKEEKVRVLARYVFDAKGQENWLSNTWRNLLGVTAFYRLGRGS